jgi:hypothetical protein
VVRRGDRDAERHEVWDKQKKSVAREGSSRLATSQSCWAPMKHRKRSRNSSSVVSNGKVAMARRT